MVACWAYDITLILKNEAYIVLLCMKISLTPQVQLVTITPNYFCC